MNLVKFGATLVKSKFTGGKIPFQVNIHLNDQCNLRCKYCYIDFDNPAKDLAFEHIKMIFEDMHAMGGQRVSLEGGEPLMRKDIGEIVEAAHELGLETNINTNAYYLPTKIDELKKVSMFSVSLDGDEQSHDKNRGKRSFSKAIKGIQVAREHGIKVQVLSVMTKANRNCVDFMINLSKELGFSWVPTSVFLNGGCERTKEMAKSHLLDDEEYRKLLNELLERKKQGEPIVWSSNTLNYVKSWPISYGQQSNFSFDEGKKVQEKSNFKALTCQAARYFCVVQTNGDLYSCDPQLGFGPKINFIELGFKEAFSRLGTNGCQACNSLVCSELHQLFSMKPGTVANLLKNYGKAG